MRHVALLFAILGGAGLTFVSARYGYKLSDDPNDAITWGFLYGSITAGGLYGHAFAQRTYRHHNLWGAFIFIVAAMATIISLSNALGSLASRGNNTTAQAEKTASDVDMWRSELAAKRLERGSLQERGKAIPPQLVADIKDLTGKLERSGPVVEANPLGAALTRLFNMGKEEAKKLSTWQNILMLAVVELMVAAAMIGYEIQTHAHHQERAQLGERVPLSVGVSRAPQLGKGSAPLIAVQQHPRLISSQAEPYGNVFDFVADATERGSGRLELNELGRAYTRACKEQGKKAVTPERFAEDIKSLCRASGIRIQNNGENVYLSSVRFKQA